MHYRTWRTICYAATGEPFSGTAMGWPVHFRVAGRIAAWLHRASVAEWVVTMCILSQGTVDWQSGVWEAVHTWAGLMRMRRTTCSCTDCRAWATRLTCQVAPCAQRAAILVSPHLHFLCWLMALSGNAIRITVSLLLLLADGLGRGVPGKSGSHP